jgi:hypothetical protein
MYTEQNTNFEDVDDQISQEENQLNQEFERTEGDPSWSGEQQEENSDLESEEVSDDEIQFGSQISDDQEEIKDEVENEVEDEIEQKNTPQEDSRRVLSFSDYFNNSNFYN